LLKDSLSFLNLLVLNLEMNCFTSCLLQEILIYPNTAFGIIKIKVSFRTWNQFFISIALDALTDALPACLLCRCLVLLLFTVILHLELIVFLHIIFI